MNYNIVEFLQAVEEIPVWDREPAISNDNLNKLLHECALTNSIKPTGIVRRVDDLGRIVIPKAVRHDLRIEEGQPMELYEDGYGSVIFRKYESE